MLNRAKMLFLVLFPRTDLWWSGSFVMYDMGYMINRKHGTRIFKWAVASLEQSSSPQYLPALTLPSLKGRNLFQSLTLTRLLYWPPFCVSLFVYKGHYTSYILMPRRAYHPDQAEQCSSWPAPNQAVIQKGRNQTPQIQIGPDLLLRDWNPQEEGLDHLSIHLSGCWTKKILNQK